MLIFYILFLNVNTKLLATCPVLVKVLYTVFALQVYWYI